MAVNYITFKKQSFGHSAHAILSLVVISRICLNGPWRSSGVRSDSEGVSGREEHLVWRAEPSPKPVGVTQALEGLSGEKGGGRGTASRLTPELRHGPLLPFTALHRPSPVCSGHMASTEQTP